MVASHPLRLNQLKHNARKDVATLLEDVQKVYKIIDEKRAGYQDLSEKFESNPMNAPKSIVNPYSAAIQYLTTFLPPDGPSILQTLQTNLKHYPTCLSVQDGKARFNCVLGLRSIATKMGRETCRTLRDSMEKSRRNSKVDSTKETNMESMMLVLMMAMMNSGGQKNSSDASASNVNSGEAKNSSDEPSSDVLPDLMSQVPDLCSNLDLAMTSLGALQEKHPLGKEENLTEKECEREVKPEHLQ